MVMAIGLKVEVHSKTFHSKIVCSVNGVKNCFTWTIVENLLIQSARHSFLIQDLG